MDLSCSHATCCRHQNSCSPKPGPFDTDSSSSLSVAPTVHQASMLHGTFQNSPQAQYWDTRTHKPLVVSVVASAGSRESGKNWNGTWSGDEACRMLNCSIWFAEECIYSFLSVRMYVCTYVGLSVCLSVWLSMPASVCLYVCACASVAVERTVIACRPL